MIATEERLQTKEEKISYPPALKILAQVLSYVFHPLFIPIYIGLFLIYSVRLFPDLDDRRRLFLEVQLFVIYTLLPLASILLMKGLGLIQTIYLRSQKDRVLPYVVCEIFYFWAWYVLKNQLLPKEIILFSLGIFLASCIGLIANTFLKVSMHAISAGVVVAFMIFCGLRWEDNYGFYISIAILLAGLIGTSRLILSQHDPKEIYAGFLIGIVAVLVSIPFV
jgi:small basic protein